MKRRFKKNVRVLVKKKADLEKRGKNDTSTAKRFGQHKISKLKKI